MLQLRAEPHTNFERVGHDFRTSARAPAVVGVQMQSAECEIWSLQLLVVVSRKLQNMALAALALNL